MQISDTHIGFNKDANPDVNATLTQTIDLVNRMPDQPALIIHTGDITHLSKPTEFDLAQQLFSRFRVTLSGQTLDGEAWGEPVDVVKHQPAVEVKGATYTALSVRREAQGSWIAQCVVDV